MSQGRKSFLGRAHALKAIYSWNISPKHAMAMNRHMWCLIMVNWFLWFGLISWFWVVFVMRCHAGSGDFVFPERVFHCPVEGSIKLWFASWGGGYDVIRCPERIVLLGSEKKFGGLCFLGNGVCSKSWSSTWSRFDRLFENKKEKFLIIILCYQLSESHSSFMNLSNLGVKYFHSKYMFQSTSSFLPTPMPRKLLTDPRQSMTDIKVDMLS